MDLHDTITITAGESDIGDWVSDGESEGHVIGLGMGEGTYIMIDYFIGINESGKNKYEIILCDAEVKCVRGGKNKIQEQS